MSTPEWIRSLGLGRLLLRFYHQPVGRLKSVWQQGGPLAIRRTEKARQEMIAAAATLPPLPAPPTDTPFCVHLVTGRGFWYQTAFCLHSLSRTAEAPIRAEIYDDGTIDSEIAGLLSRLGSAIRIHPLSETMTRLEKHLPAARFPVLRERWLNYPNIRKLIDVHLGSSGWKLVLDSDLLFFRKPTCLLDWLRSPDRPLHAVDCEESYGYTRATIERVLEKPVPPLVNVGLCGLKSDSIDWDQLERWCAELIRTERTSYFLEQALVAMLVAGRECTIAPAREYVTMPLGNGVAAHEVMHHYVAHSKRFYFREGWRRVLEAQCRGG